MASRSLGSYQYMARRSSASTRAIVCSGSSSTGVRFQRMDASVLGSGTNSAMRSYRSRRR